MLPVQAEIGPILITAPETSRPVFQTGDVAAGEYTGSRETIEGPELQRSGETLAEVAAAESGVQFRQSGGLGSYSTVTLRGSSAAQVNVYLDGVLLNEAAGGGVNFSDIELLDASQVDIYSGVVPVQFGNSAIGGAVNITTLRAGSKASTRLLLGAGSFGSSRLSSAWSGPVGGWKTDQLVATFAHRRAENDFGFLNNNRTPLNTADDSHQRRSNSQTATTSGLLKTSHDLNRFGRMENALQFFRREQGLSDWRNLSTTRATLDTSNLQFRSSLRQQPGSSGWAGLWDFSFNTKAELFNDSAGDIGLGQQKIESDTRVAGVRLYREKVQQNRTLAGTLKWRSESLDSRDVLGFSAPTSAQRMQIDGAFQYTRYLNDGGSVVSLGLFATALDDTYKIENLANRRSDFSDSGITPQLGFSHSVNAQWTVRGNLAAQRRAPSFFELFGSRGFFEGNSDLKAEQSTNLDFAVDWQSDAKAKHDIALEAVVFYGQRKDLITRVYDARGVGRAENVSRAVVSGVEIDGAMDWRNGFSLSANVTLQDARNRSSISSFNGRQLPGEAQLEAGLGMHWANERWRFSYRFSYAGERYYDTLNLLQADDQVSHAASVSRQWRDWRLLLELHNLSDRNFEDFNGFPKPGRAGYLSLFYQPVNNR